jgi:hypothetical protein
MSEGTPPPWFGHDAASDERDEDRRRKKLEEELPSLLKKQVARGRAKNFYPYLLVRSVLGDRGDRPINTPTWESPDIWTAQGDPATAPDIPPNHGGTVIAGQPNTLYAHVWNLGFAPLVGVRVEFYWFNPSLNIDGAHAHSIGVARCELSSRGMAGSHKLVKCPIAWIPVIENGGHECLFVRVSGVGDPIGNHEWQASQNRHVAQRNISVVAAGASVQRLVASLNLTRRRDAHVQLIQLGPREGALAARIVAPKLKVARIDSHLLGELTTTNKIVLRQLKAPSPGMFAPIHPLAHGIDMSAPVLRGKSLTTQVIDPQRVLRDVRPVRPAKPSDAPVVDLAELLTAVDRLHPGRTLGLPAPGTAFVLRLASYVGEQLVGGYTLVIGGQG